MRIIILGDFHLTPDQPQIADDAIDDINRARPDLVIPLGDFGSGGKIGKPQGLEESWTHLRKLDAPLRPILGNHDLQEESAGKREPYSMLQALHQISGVEAGGGFMEFDDFRLMFASTDPQPADSCWTVQECYVASEQFEQLMATFKKRPGVPVIAFTHAPPIGCCLRTVPTVHVRCTNAYLDQNHDVYRWEKFYCEHPEPLMWFSAHYHLGHDNPDSATHIDGTHFFQTQIHGLQTRDETRASRVLDIMPEGVTVSTLDHISRQIIGKSQWRFAGSLTELMEQKRQILARGRVQNSSFTISSAALPGCVQTLSNDRLLIGTDDGFLWEVELSTRSVLGTLHIGPLLSGVALAEDDVWRSWENTIVRVSQNDLARFIRIKDPQTLPGQNYQLAEPVLGLVHFQDTLFALGAQHLWKYAPSENAFQQLSPLPAKPAQGTARVEEDQLIYTDNAANYWQWNGDQWEEKVLLESDIHSTSETASYQIGNDLIAIKGNEIFFL